MRHGSFLTNPTFLSELEDARLHFIAGAVDEVAAAIAAEQEMRSGRV